MMKMTLSDGTVIDNLQLNGNNFVSQAEILPDVFFGKLTTVTIEEDGEVTTMNNCELEYVRQYGEEWWFVLREQTQEEIARASDEAQILYTALMTDTLLEE